MGHLDEPEQVGLCAITSSDRTALILAAEVEAIPQIVANGKSAAPFGGGREPERIVTGLGQLRHLQGDLVPVGIEVLEHGLTLGG